MVRDQAMMRKCGAAESVVTHTPPSAPTPPPGTIFNAAMGDILANATFSEAECSDSKRRLGSTGLDDRARRLDEAAAGVTVISEVRHPLYPLSSAAYNEDGTAHSDSVFVRVSSLLTAAVSDGSFSAAIQQHAMAASGSGDGESRRRLAVGMVGAIADSVSIDTFSPTLAPSPVLTAVPTAAPSDIPTPAPSSTHKLTPAAVCEDSCYGQSCDYWHNFGYSCAVLESTYNCSCGDCDCDGDDTTAPSMSAAPAPFPSYSPTHEPSAMHKPTPRPTSCEDTADGDVADAGGRGCAAYLRHPNRCGRQDDDDFSASDVCCVCGGGARGTTAPSMSAAPTPFPSYVATPAAVCEDTCFGQSCDFWDDFGYSCAVLESTYNCGCGGCDCDGADDNDDNGDEFDNDDDGDDFLTTMVCARGSSMSR